MSIAINKRNKTITLNGVVYTEDEARDLARRLLDGVDVIRAAERKEADKPENHSLLAELGVTKKHKNYAAIIALTKKLVIAVDHATYRTYLNSQDVHNSRPVSRAPITRLENSIRKLAADS